MCGHTIVTMITIYEIVNVSIACVCSFHGTPRLSFDVDNDNDDIDDDDDDEGRKYQQNIQTNVRQMELNIDE